MVVLEPTTRVVASQPAMPPSLQCRKLHLDRLLGTAVPVLECDKAESLRALLDYVHHDYGLSRELDQAKRSPV